MSAPSTISDTAVGCASMMRRLKIWHFIVFAVVYIVIVQGANALLSAGEAGFAAPTSVDGLVRAMVVPVGLGIVFVLAVLTYMGAWQRIFVDSFPVRRWVLAVPITLLVTVLVITHYTGLAEKGLTFALLLLVATLMVGFGEELLFRGIGVTIFRDNGFSEFKVGLWTTIAFGVAHGSNIFTAGVGALLQVILTSATGLLFYLVMRSTGALLMAALVHGLWDFAVLSTQVNPDAPSPLTNLSAVVLGVILVGLLVMRRRISLPVTPDPTRL